MSERFYKKFCSEQFDKNGVLCAFDAKYPDNFNFGYDVVDAIAAAEPGRKALLWTNEQGDERTFTFEDMRVLSNKAANFFLSQGVGKGDMVMLILKRHWQFWAAIIGLHKIGAVTIPATNLLTVKDVVYRGNSAGIKAAVVTGMGEIADNVLNAQSQLDMPMKLFIANGTHNGFVSFDDGLEAASGELDRVETKANDPLLLYFTSGTTGYPKMVLHDHTYPIGHIITAVHWHNIPRDGLHLTVSETGWGKAVWGKLYGQWFAEACVFVYDYDKFVPSDMLSLFGKYGITSFCAPPTIYRFLIQEDVSGYDLSSLKYATIAGEALNPEVFNKFYELTGIKLMEAFGQTEMTMLIGTLPGMEPRPGSMGKPSPLYTVALENEDGEPVVPGEVGEIVVKTCDGVKQLGLFSGYYRDEDRTRQAWHDNTYHTGDTAWMDEDGYYWYVGRTDDIIKSSGYRIGPFEIESVLMEHEAVMECAVTGVPDEIRGQVVKATVVLARGFTPSDKLKKELQEFVKAQTAPYKYPRIVEFMDALPKTISGKIKRVELR